MVIFYNISYNYNPVDDRVVNRVGIETFCIWVDAVFNFIMITGAITSKAMNEKKNKKVGENK